MRCSTFYESGQILGDSHHHRLVGVFSESVRDEGPESGRSEYGVCSARNFTLPAGWLRALSNIMRQIAFYTFKSVLSLAL